LSDSLLILPRSYENGSCSLRSSWRGAGQNRFARGTQVISAFRRGARIASSNTTEPIEAAAGRLLQAAHAAEVHLTEILIV